MKQKKRQNEANDSKCEEEGSACDRHGERFTRLGPSRTPHVIVQNAGGKNEGGRKVREKQWQQ